MKQVDTLVGDIYTLLETREVPEGVELDAICEQFGRDMAALLRSAVAEPDDDKRGLRLSAIGKPDRQIYHAVRSVAKRQLRGPTYLKFLYGHITEALVLALTRASGHTVTNEQKQVRVEGVKGHIDCDVDGFLLDVKSCSSYGFKKFKNNTLHEDDPFGYIGQIKAYAHAMGRTEYGWLAFDKQNGTLALLKYDEAAKDAPYAKAIDFDVAKRVRYLKKLVSEDSLPIRCYSPVPDGKSGNLKLPAGCSYCDFREQCWPDVRTYYYATGPRYLVHVEKEPTVTGVEIPDDF